MTDTEPEIDLERQPFRVGDWRAFPTLNRLERGEQSKTVEPRTMAVLVFLAQRAGEVVSLNGMVEHVWDGRPIGDNAVHRVLSKLRQALDDDDRQNPRYIQTIPKRGYRLLCPVTAIEEKADESRQSSVADLRVDDAGVSPSIIGELTRRGVPRVAILYAIVAWLLLQVAEVTFEPFGIPMWVMRLLIVITVLGFPLALFLSWALKVTPEGIVREKPTQAAGRRPGMGLALLALLLVTLGLLVYTQFFIEREPGVAQVVDPDAAVTASIVVLPFANLSGNSNNEYFADGLSEELILLLSRIEGLEVAARTSSFHLKGADLDIAETAERLGVSHVLDGGVRRDGDRVRVTAQLIDAMSGFTRWSEVYDRTIADVFAIQADIGSSVADSLKLVMAADERERIDAPPTDNVDAYLFYLQARDYLRRRGDAVNIDSAAALFRSAIELDPDFALAPAGLCEALLRRFSDTGTVALFDDAKLACERALALDDTLVEVHTALGALYRESGQYDESQRELRQVISADPTQVDALIELGYTYYMDRDSERAEQTFRQAVEIKPGYWATHAALADFLFKSERYAESVPYWEQAALLTPDSARSYNDLAAAHYMLGDYERAVAAWEHSLSLAPSALAYTNMGMYSYYLGRFGEAADLQRQALELAPDDHGIWGRLAECYRFIPGEEAQSTQAYEKAIALATDVLEVNDSDAETTGLLALYYARSGDTDRARASMARARSLSPQNSELHYIEALVEHTFGDDDATLRSIARALQLGFPSRLIKTDPDLQPLLETEPMKELLAQYESEPPSN